MHYSFSKRNYSEDRNVVCKEKYLHQEKYALSL